MGSDLKFESLDAIRQGAEGLLEDDRGPVLPHDAFVFCSHQGYQFLFSLLDGSADPAIHYSLEGNHEFSAVRPSFSEWLRGAVHDEFPVEP